MNTVKQLSSRLKKLLSHITVKQIIIIIVFGVAISVASCVIGYIEFSNTIKNTYNNEVHEIAKFVIENIDIDVFEQDMKRLESNFYEIDNPVFEEISKQPSYQQLVKQANYLQNSFEGLDIFVGTYDKSYNKEYLKYLESGKSKEENTDEVIQMLKDGQDVISIYYRSPDVIPENRRKDYPGGLLLCSDQEQVTLHQVYDEKTTIFADSKLIMGDTDASSTLFSVNEPLINKSGDMVGYVNVSITIGVLQKLLSRYLFLVGCLTILIGIVFIFIYIRINHKLFLNPILSIIKGTSNFVENNNQITESLTEIKTGDEIQTLAESILKLEEDINTYIDNLETITAERERVKTELDLATNIQMSMLPQTFPAFPDRNEFDIYAMMDPAREVGGDFYNFFLIDDDHLGVVIGDVSGKGVPAALFMMIGNILIKAQSLPELKTNEIIEKVNDILSENNAEMLFITSWMGIYEISTNTVSFINAGHEPPVLIHEDGEMEVIQTKPNMVLGSFSGIPYKLHEFKVRKGDKFFVTTDGVPEAQDIDENFYGKERFIDVIKSTYKESLENIIKKVRQDINEFAGEAEQFDDITIVGVEIKQDIDEEK